MAGRFCAPSTRYDRRGGRDVEQDKAILRARDFWGACVLIVVSLFFLWRTFDIPLWGQNNAGVAGINWYESAAIVPLGIFTALLVLGFVLLGIAIRDGGAAHALSAAGIGWDREEAIRFSTIAVILAFYIFGLVPRVDFVLGSGLLITALIWGFHGGVVRRMVIAAAFVISPAAYALIAHFPQAEWGQPHDDDWITLAAWVGLIALSLWRGPRDKIAKATLWIAVISPLVLVCAMAFGFRQNVPNRGGLIFSQIEYHYYVTLRPLWRD